MSDKSKREYTLLKSQVYRLTPRTKRKAILTKYCAVTEHKPSYARKLLNDNRKYRIRKARGKNFLVNLNHYNMIATIKRIFTNFKTSI